MRMVKDFRRIAWESMQKDYWIAFVVSLVESVLAGSLVSVAIVIELARLLNKTAGISVQDAYRSPVSVTLIIILIIALVIASIWIIIQFLLGGTVNLGNCRYYVQLVEKKESKFSLLFSGVDSFGKALGLRCWQILWIFIWSVMLIVPGIIAAYRYSMSPYILAENPDMSVREAMRESKRIMHGNKLRLFRLYMSFIGWFILCVLTLGVGWPFLAPYVNAAVTAFYLDVSGQSYRMSWYIGSAN